MRLFRPRVFFIQLVLYSAPLIGTISIPVPAQPIGSGYDTYQTEVLFDMDIEGDSHQHLLFRMGGQAVIHRATAEAIKSVTSELIIPIDGFSVFPGGFTLSDFEVFDATIDPTLYPPIVFSVSDFVTSATAVPVFITWPPPFTPLPPPTPVPRACWEVCYDFYFDTVRWVLNTLIPPRGNKQESLTIQTSLPIPLCIPTFLQSIPFSTLSPSDSTAPPEQAFTRILSCMTSLPLVDEASKQVGMLNALEVTLYPSINSYQTRWNLSFSRLNPAGSPGTANLTGPTRIVGGWFFHEGSISQQIQAIHVSNGNVSLDQSSKAFSYGKMVSDTGNLPAQSFFSGLFELTIDGVQVFNKTPVFMQTTPEDVEVFPFQNVLHYASNCPVALFRVSDPDGPPAFQIDSLTFVCLSSISWQIPSYGCYVECRTPAGHPLKGIPFSLYEGPGGAGSPIASATTNSEGIARFGSLPFADYSVREDVPPGFTPINSQVQDFLITQIGYTPEFYGSISGHGFGGNPPSLPGRESFQMALNFDMNVNGATEHIILNGPFTFQRGSPYDAGLGNQAFEAELISGQVTGEHPVLGRLQVRESPSRPSRGRYQQTNPLRFYPCESYFDVFLEIRWTGQDWIRNSTAIRLFCPRVDAYPPIGDLFQGPLGETVFDDGSMPAPPRVSKVEGRCIPGWWYGGVYVLLPPEETATPTMTPIEIPTPTPTTTPRPGDTTADGVLNADDILIFSRFFHRPSGEAAVGCNPVGDATVDQHDLLILIKLWITDFGD